MKPAKGLSQKGVCRCFGVGDHASEANPELPSAQADNASAARTHILENNEGERKCQVRQA